MIWDVKDFGLYITEFCLQLQVEDHEIHFPV